jgi:hypothetical protein
MARRLTVEPRSRLATWSFRLALFALPVALIGLILARGFAQTLIGFVAFAAALALALAGMLLACAAFVVIWRNGNPGLGRAIGALFLGVALLAYPAFIAVQSRNLPRLSDVTTDTADPPRFETVAGLRQPGANPVAYSDGPRARAQRAAYPFVVPLLTPATPADAHAGVLGVVKRRRWVVVNDRPPQAGRDGHIEAVAQTLIMGFRDDVAIRIRASGSGAIIDIRSASRFGGHDFGANARRIRSLRTDIEDELRGGQPKTAR